MATDVGGKTFFVVPTSASGWPFAHPMITMTSDGVLRATSPSAMLKATLQTRSSRRCRMMSERSTTGYWIRILAACIYEYVSYHCSRHREV